MFTSIATRVSALGTLFYFTRLPSTAEAMAAIIAAMPAMMLVKGSAQSNQTPIATRKIISDILITILFSLP